MKKILLFGPEVTDFLNPLAKKFRELGYTVDLLENRKSHRINDNISAIYSNVYNYQDLISKKIRPSDVLRYIFKKSVVRNIIKEISTSYLEGKISILKSLKSSINFQHLSEIFSLILNKYDIINFHSLSSSTVDFVHFIKPEKKIVFSFWGSDLFQINGIKNYSTQFNALSRADLITVQSYEMELVVLAKFGTAIKGKIVRALFGINNSVFEKLDFLKSSAPDLHFLKKYSIPENKIKVTICYCGNPVCNHLQIIDELEKLSLAVKERIHLMVPMTYGNFTKDYLEEVKLRLDHSKITYTLLQEYLPYDDVLNMRVHSDIMVMMNKSDALSQSVSEFIYAENLLISAAWLPYSPFRLAGVFMFESDFDMLAESVTQAVNNYPDLKNKIKLNPDRVKKFTSFSSVWKQWTELIESLN